MRKNDSGWRWFDDPAFVICLILIAAVICVLFAIPAKAETTQARGVMCDTAEQMEAYVTLAGNGTPATEALELVNASAGKDTACGGMIVIINEHTEVKAVRVGEHDLTIVSVVIVAVASPNGMMPVPAMVQFMAVATKALHPTRSAI